MSRDINVDMAVKYQREIDNLKDEKLSLIQMVETKDTEIERLRKVLKTCQTSSITANAAETRYLTVAMPR